MRGVSVADALKAAKSPVRVDDLTVKTGLSAGQVLAQITLLEINGQVNNVGGRYSWAAKRKAVKAKKPVRSSKSKRSSGAVVVSESCGCRTVRRDSGTGRFAKKGR